jgi:hypothetical protein
MVSESPQGVDGGGHPFEPRDEQQKNCLNYYIKSTLNSLFDLDVIA